MPLPIGNVWHPVAWEPMLHSYPAAAAYTPVVGQPVALVNGELQQATWSTDHYSFTTNKLAGFVYGVKPADAVEGGGVNILSSRSRFFLFRCLSDAGALTTAAGFPAGTQVTISRAAGGETGVRKNITTKHGVVRQVLRAEGEPDDWRAYWVLVELNDATCLP